MLISSSAKSVESNVAAVPKPKFVRASASVVAPVPPNAILIGGVIPPQLPASLYKKSPGDAGTEILLVEIPVIPEPSPKSPAAATDPVAVMSPETDTAFSANAIKSVSVTARPIWLPSM